MIRCDTQSWRLCVGRRSLSLAFLVAPSARVASAQSQQAIALEFVRTFQLGGSLTHMAATMIPGTIAYRVIVRKAGEDGAQALVAEHLGRTAARYQDEWDRNLAASFLDYLDGSELVSLMRERGASPYVEKWRRHHADITGRMEARSRELLTTVVVETLSSANAAAPEPPLR